MDTDPNAFADSDALPPRIRLTGRDSQDPAYTPPPSPEPPALSSADYALPSTTQFAGGPYSFNGSVPLYGQMARLDLPTALIPPEDSGGGIPYCPLGQIVSWVESGVTKTGIRGGFISCGDQNWNMDPHAVNLSVSGTWLVYFEVSVTVNTDDDHELLLPGVKTGTKPTTWSTRSWTTGTDYPANTTPTPADGHGKVILPIGKLTVADGAATIDPAGCGSFFITHCAGTLSFTRAT